MLALAATVSCVAYDSAGPPVPSIDGTYAAAIVIDYSNYFEARTDTLVASIALRDTHYRGHFDGAYRIADDSGSVAGILRPEGTLVVTEFGAPPQPISHVAALRQRYAWCDFTRMGSGPLPGQLRGDSLLLDGSASLPCFYQVFGETVEIGTELRLHISGVR
jgi:hypothetical protein